MNISERLKWLRQTNDLKQVDLSKALGISRGYFSTLESVPESVNDRIIKLYASYFAVREMWIRNGELPIREPSAETLKNEFASTYFDIAAEVYPTFEVPELFVLLLKNSLEYARMFHYISYRFMATNDKNEPKRLSALFSVAFPDYITKTDEIFSHVTLSEKEARRSPPLAKRVLPILPVGKVAAGTPVLDSGSEEVTVELPIKYLDPEHYLSFEVQGNSMEPRLHNGDIVFVERNVHPQPGQIAVVHTIDGDLNDGYLIKKFHKEKGRIKLVSLNEEYPPIFFKEEEILDAQVVVYEVHK